MSKEETRLGKQAETFTLMNSVQLWRKLLHNAHDMLIVMGDALRVLHDARNSRRKTES